MADDPFELAKSPAPEEAVRQRVALSADDPFSVAKEPSLYLPKLLQSARARQTPWEELEGPVKAAGYDPGKVRQQYQLDRERDRQSGEGVGVFESIGRSSIPFVSEIRNFEKQKEYHAARQRFDEGNASDDDLRTIARFERLSEIDRRMSETLGGAAVQALGAVPKFLGEAYGAGRVLGLAGRLPGVAGRAGAALAAPAETYAGGAARFATRQAVTTPLMPSMYLGKAAEINTREGRAPDDIRGFPPAIALGYANNLVLGSLQPLARGLPGGRIPAAVGAGVLGVEEQAGVDVLAGLADEVLPKAYRTGTRYGVYGDLARGENGKALRDATVQALTFSLFAGLHGESPQAVTKEYTTALERLSKAGYSPEAAGTALRKLHGELITPEGRVRVVGFTVDEPLKPYAKQLTRTLSLGPHEEGPRQLLPAPETPPEAPGGPPSPEAARPAPEPAEGQKPPEAASERLFHVPDYKAKDSNLGATRSMLLGDTFGQKWWSRGREQNEGYLTSGKFQIEFDRGAVGEGDVYEERGRQEASVGSSTPMYLHPGLKVVRYKGEAEAENARDMRRLVEEVINPERAKAGLEPVAFEATSTRPERAAGMLFKTAETEVPKKAEPVPELTAPEHLERLFAEKGLTDREKAFVLDYVHDNPSLVSRQAVSQTLKKVSEKLGVDLAAVRQGFRQDRVLDLAERGGRVDLTELHADPDAAREKIARRDKKYASAEAELEALKDQYLKEIERGQLSPERAKYFADRVAALHEQTAPVARRPAGAAQGARGAPAAGQAPGDRGRAPPAPAEAPGGPAEPGKSAESGGPTAAELRAIAADPTGALGVELRQSQALTPEEAARQARNDATQQQTYESFQQEEAARKAARKAALSEREKLVRRAAVKFSRDELDAIAKELGVKASWFGRYPNKEQLARVIAQRPGGEERLGGKPAEPGRVAEPDRSTVESPDPQFEVPPGEPLRARRFGGGPRGRPGKITLPGYSGSRLEAIVNHVGDGIRALRDEWEKMAGRMFPAAARRSARTADAMARLVSAQAIAEAGWKYIRKAVFGPLKPEAWAKFYTAHLQARLDYMGSNTSLIGPDSPITTRAEYRRIINSPAFKRYLDRWKAVVVPIMEAHYRDAEGLAPNAPVPSQTQIPGYPVNLVNARPEAASASTIFSGGVGKGRLENVKAGKLGFARQATGVSKRGYETDPEKAIPYALSVGASKAAKAVLYRTAEAEGVGAWAKPGDPLAMPPQPPFIAGEPAVAVRDVDPPKNTQAAAKGQTDFRVAEPLYKDFRAALQTDERPRIPVLTPILNFFTRASIASTVEFTFHSANQLTNALRPRVLRELVPTVWGVVRNFGMTEAHLGRLFELSQIGATKEKGFEAGMLLGAKYAHLDPTAWASRFLDGLDNVVRLSMDRAFTKMAAQGLAADTPANRRDFLNQMGQYKYAAQAKIVQLLRATGIGPFATAATNFVSQGIRNLFLSPGLKAATPAAAARLRAERFAALAGAMGGAALLNYAIWGRWDGGDDVPLGGVKLFSWGGRTYFVDVGRLTGLTRGLRSVGAMPWLEAGLREKDPSTAARVHGSVVDVTHALLHPATGPGVSFGYTAVTGRNTLGADVAGKPEEGSVQEWENFKAAVRNANPTLATVLGFDRVRPGESLPFLTPYHGEGTQDEMWQRFLRLGEPYLRSRKEIGFERQRELEEKATKKR